MTKGRNTQSVRIRLPDTVVDLLKKRAGVQGIPYSALARHMIQEKLGLPRS